MSCSREKGAVNFSHSVYQRPKENVIRSRAGEKFDHDLQILVNLASIL